MEKSYKVNGCEFIVKQQENSCVVSFEYVNGIFPSGSKIIERRSDLNDNMLKDLDKKFNLGIKFYDNRID